MTGFVVVGTDTDAGKTAFSLMFLAAFPDTFAYWKPVETGDSDAEKVRRLVPRAVVLPPLARFSEPVAPVLAARREGRAMPGVADILAARPSADRPLLIETFGGPMSPLTDDVLQLDLIRAFALPVVLVSSAAVGAVARTLQAAAALEHAGLRPVAVALTGADDAFACDQITRRLGGIPVACHEFPAGEWTRDSLAAAAERSRWALQRVEPIVRAGPTFGGRPTDIAAADARAVWHPYTPLQSPDAPLAVAAADDEFLTLDDGRRLIDGISSWWTILHGHRPPAIMQAVRDATHQLDHVLFAGATHPAAVELATSLLGSMPWGPGGRVFYSDNGSTAVEVALKMAYQAWCHRGEAGRTLFVGFEHGYHGDTFGAMSLSRDPVFFGRFEPLLFRALQVPLSADALDAALTHHAGEVAGVLVEPLVQGAGGMRLHTPEELRALFEVTRRHGVPFIADEVMTGFGRTGSLWAFEQAGIAPDLVCAAKGITGGVLPLAATLASPEVVAAFDTADRTRTFFHGHSFTANPIACAAAVASWRLLQTGRWRTDVRRIEAHWLAAAAGLRKLHGVKDARVRGLILAAELDVPGGYLADVGRAMRLAALERGVLLRPLGNVLYALPPLCTSDDSLARIADAMVHAVRSCGL
ncbi:adenosylmethionine--8-amino-7-oxononanoate transaminase [Urbifossiella limnaea]|uniref:Multifunctional fusion protein n=1 Tax=Urbifossiella limnaea TaxID=2528023 RepID=A0A517XUC4_9BACT|nr:adenosylmethionine--8-amino-7-oxononanoate transaminase [Urbifossiella limnaea]QDU21100.1 Adenosylmethionine-8-amino-7-oxononanoate aminotransferase [Urbifossiella limnaea]